MKKKLLLGIFAIVLFALTVAACNFFDNKEEKNVITFIVDDEVYATVETKGEEKISLPTNPTKEDYIFDGWYFDKDVWSSPFSANSFLNEKLTENLSVYAKWRIAAAALGEIKYDTTKKAISIHDTINATLFDASCIDANGKPANITVSVVGDFRAGKTVSILIIAQAKGVAPKSKTISNVKVYGDPSVQVSDDVQDYINMSDEIGEWKGKVELNNLLFNGIGKDSFGEPTQIHVTVNGSFEAGKVVNVVIHAVDIVGNETTKSIKDIKVYGAPQITYNERIKVIRQTDNLTPEFFGATAHDSFGEPINIILARKSGTQVAGNKIIINLSATDSKGNKTTLDIADIKVYGMPIIGLPKKTNFKINEEITVESLGLTVYDSFNDLPEISLSFIAGEQKAGTAAKYIATATDIAGNTTTREIEIKIYDMPTITIGRTFVNDKEEINSNTLQTTATDSFNQPIDVILTLKNGTFMGGNIVYYSFMAEDLAGNVCLMDDVGIKVYSQDGINFNYKDSIPQVMKLTSRGEEFITDATDSFGEPCTITLKTAEGYILKGGRKISLYIVATDIAGNIKRSNLFSNIKVYDIPTLRPADETIGFSISSASDLDSLFVVEDSFGNNLAYKAEISDAIAAGNYINVTVTASDDANNEFSEICRVAVVEDSTCVVLLFWGDELLDTLIVDNANDYTLPIPAEYEAPKGWYSKTGTAYTNSQGKGNMALSTTSYNYLYLHTNYTIFSAQELKSMRLSGDYILMTDIDLQGATWTPIGTYKSPFSGTFDGNGHSITNFKINGDLQYTGLFGYIDNATIKNLSVKDFNITSSNEDISSSHAGIGAGYSIYAGGLIGYNCGIVNNCHVSGIVSAASNGVSFRSNNDAYVGMIASYNLGTISNCSASGSATAVAHDISYAGGLVGFNKGIINNCYATTVVKSQSNNDGSIYNGLFPYTRAYAGGLVGFSGPRNMDEDVYVAIINCYATGSVNASAYAYSGPDSSGKANATARAYAGGLVGSINSSLITKTDCLIKNCYATGNVTAYGSANTSTDAAYSEWVMALAGGIVGRNGDNLWGGTVTNCYRLSGQTVSAIKVIGYDYPTDDKFTPAPTVSLFDLQSEIFLIGTLNWCDDDWIFHENDYPTLRG